VPADATVEVETTETVGAITCPKCSRIMMKYKLTGRVSNRLDVCTLCDDAWLDGGEWELLEALHLSHRIPAIFTEQWQRRIRSEQSEELRRSILVRGIGEAGLVRVEEFKRWLVQAPNRSEIMAFLIRR
jgi:Zn-finger nucleic acid-binding protein